MGKSSAQRKEFDELMGELRRQGWGLAQTGAGHWKATPPDKKHTIVHFSISGDPHAFKNTISDLRKRGLVWPPKKREAEREAPTEDWFETPHTTAEREEDGEDKVKVTSDEQLQAILAEQEAEEHAELEGRAAERHVNGVMREYPAEPPFKPGIVRTNMDYPPETEDEEERMERLFRELKEAKSYLTLAQHELAEREHELVAVTKKRDDAREEQARAAEKLRGLKATFDSEFARGAP